MCLFNKPYHLHCTDYTHLNKLASYLLVLPFNRGNSCLLIFIESPWRWGGTWQGHCCFSTWSCTLLWSGLQVGALTVSSMARPITLVSFMTNLGCYLRTTASCIYILLPQLRTSSGFGGNGATMFFLVFSLMSGVLGVISKLAGAIHIRAWRNDSLAAAGASSLVAWAVTALAFGYVRTYIFPSSLYIYISSLYVYLGYYICPPTSA